MGRLGPRLGRALRGGFFCYYAAGLVDENRALPEASAFAFLVFAVAAVVFLVRLFL